MVRLWLVALAQVALAAALHVLGRAEASGLDVTLTLAMVGWLLAEGRRGDR
ncbi:MAG: hypothetical protein WD557_03990 [Dehalococcoidia bacterium]